MKYSASMVPTALVLLGGLLLAACSEDGVSPLPDMTAGVLLAHTPAHHGVSATASVTSAPDYASVNDGAAEGRGGSLHLLVSAAGAIPRHADSFISSVAVFGYAWVDLDTGRGIVAVIHPSIGRDSRQNPDGWHTHPVELTDGTTGEGGTSNFCIVSIGRSQGGIPIQGNVLRVHMAERWAGVSPADLDVVAAFVVQGDSGCAGTGLGVVVLDADML